MLGTLGLAEALYDNLAEWPDELAFRRGEVLRILDQSPGGGLAEGWWLCANKIGRRGIAPANRLRLIRSFDRSRDGSVTAADNEVASCSGALEPADSSSVITAADGVSTQENGVSSQKVVTPRRFGDVFLYGNGASGTSADGFFDDGELEDFFGYPPRGAAPPSMSRLAQELNAAANGGAYAVPPSATAGGVFRSFEPFESEPLAEDGFWPHRLGESKRLFHGSTHPLGAFDDGGSSGESYDVPPPRQPSASFSGRSTPMAPIVRNVPIKIERLGGAGIPPTPPPSFSTGRRTPPPPPVRRSHLSSSFSSSPLSELSAGGAPTFQNGSYHSSSALPPKLGGAASLFRNGSDVLATFGAGGGSSSSSNFAGAPSSNYDSPPLRPMPTSDSFPAANSRPFRSAGGGGGTQFPPPKMNTAGAVLVADGSNMNGPTYQSPAAAFMSSPASGSDRSSSLSEDSSRSGSSINGTGALYDMPTPKATSAPLTQFSQRNNNYASLPVKTPSSSVSVAEHEKLTIALLNVLEELYQNPGRSDARKLLTADIINQTVRDALNRSKDSGNFSDGNNSTSVHSASITPTGTLTQRTPAPYSFTKDSLPSPEPIDPASPKPPSTNGFSNTSHHTTAPKKSPSLGNLRIESEPGAENGSSSIGSSNGGARRPAAGPKRTVTFADVSKPPVGPYTTGPNLGAVPAVARQPTPVVARQPTYDVPPLRLQETLPAVPTTPLPTTNGHYPTVPRIPSVTKLNGFAQERNGSIGAKDNVADQADRLSVSSVDSKDSDYQALFDAKEIQLGQAAALETLSRLQANVQLAVSQLCGFVSKNWRKRELLAPKLLDIKLACRHVCGSLAEFLAFASGTFANCARGGASADQWLAKKLAQLLRPLRNSMTMLRAAMDALDAKSWQLSDLIRDSNVGNDSLDQFMAIAKAMPEDCQQVASFIQGNAALLFSAQAPPANVEKVQARPLPGLPPQGQQQVDQKPLAAASVNGDYANLEEANGERSAVQECDLEGDCSSLMSDYDYVDAAGNNQYRNGVPIANGNGLYSSEPASGKPAFTNGQTASTELTPPLSLDAEDKQMLEFYSPQVDQHLQCLSNAIDKFLQTIERNEPPAIFVGHSKFVILAAHKLVYIGDTISQCLRHKALSAKTKDCADRLCEILKQTVTSTKDASLQYPAVASVQTMVDSMVSVSHAANALKLVVQFALKSAADLTAGLVGYEPTGPSTQTHVLFYFSKLSGPLPVSCS